jgi:8-oxo-dGTP diphosphatase
MVFNWHWFSSVFKIIFHHPIVGVTIIPILPNGQIFLAFRQDTQQWSLPGGMIDWGEDIITALHRELKEETGLDVITIKSLNGIYSSPKRDPRLHSIAICITVEVYGTIKIQDTSEIGDVKVFDILDIPFGNLAHDHDRQLQDYLDKKMTIA